MIDLHVHSTFSDGSLTPAQLVDLALKQGVTALALTDHDTTDGLAPLLREAGRGVELIGGVEISLEVGKGTLHLLAYFMDPANPAFASALAQIRGGRESRNERILARLNELGLELAWADVAKFASEGVVGRPHFAAALIEKGYVADKDEAFNRYLAKGRPGYLDRFRLPVTEAVATIRGAGGVAVLAHPSTLGLGRAALRDFVQTLQATGLSGIEVYYPEHNLDQTAEYLRLTKTFDLVPTGGSDFHGSLNPAIRLGSGFGGLNVPDWIVERLKERRPAAALARQGE